MISQEETASFLEQAERFSTEWTAQAQYIRSSFLPQLEASNLHISQRCHVPNVSRETLTAFMRRSVNISAIPRYLGRNYSNTQDLHHFSHIYKEIDCKKLDAVLFTDEFLLPSSLGTDHDFVMYFDAHYKEVLLGVPKEVKQYPYTNSWGGHGGDPAHIYTNYDFYIELKVKSFSEVRTEVLNSCHPESVRVTIVPVPLWGCGPREQLSVKFISLAPTTSTSVQELVDPAPAQLAEFLRQRKPYIHPVIVLDYLREQSLQEVTAFFGGVAQRELSAATDKVALTSAAHARMAAELQASQQVSRQDRAQLAAEQARTQEKEREIQQQRTKLNTAALRIKKLEIKLAQSESMYEDLQMRLIEMEGLDGGELDSVEGDGGNEDDVTQAL